jgi:hypothetical protein
MQNGVSTGSRFVFRGTAIPVGGRVLRVREDRTPQALQSPPASSLSVAGGFSHAVSPGSAFRDIFSWGQCLAESIGETKGDGTNVTTVTASVQNGSAANGPNVFKFGQLKISVVSIHPQKGQPSITPAEVVFTDLSLNNQKIALNTDVDDFRKLSTLDQFDYEFRTNKALFKKYRERFQGSSKGLDFGQPIPRMPGGYVVCSLVNSIQWGSKKIPGNVLTLDGFGKIYFAEVLINDYNRRFTMVRLGMGSDVEAEVAYAESDGNGSWF